MYGYVYFYCSNKFSFMIKAQSHPQVFRFEINHREYTLPQQLCTSHNLILEYAKVTLHILVYHLKYYIKNMVTSDWRFSRVFSRNTNDDLIVRYRLQARISITIHSLQK